MAIYLIDKLNNKEVVKGYFLWEDAETDSIVDWQNKKRHVPPIPRARLKNVRAKPLKLRPEPVNTCVENDWPRAKTPGRKRYQSADRKEPVRSNPVWTPGVQDRWRKSGDHTYFYSFLLGTFTNFSRGLCPFDLLFIKTIFIFLRVICEIRGY